MITLKLIGAPAFSVSVRKDGALVYAAINDSLCAATGLTPAGFVGRNAEDCFPGPLGQRLAAHYAMAAETGATVEYVDLFQLPDGPMWWRTTLTFIAEETEDLRGFLLGIGVDVTAERRAEEELREAHIRLGLAFDALGGAWWHFDLATAAYEPSESLALMAGEALPRKLSLAEWRMRILPEDLRRVTLESLINGEAEHFEVEYRIRRVDGEMRWVRCVSRLVRDAEGAPSRILGVTLDITEQKLREFDLVRDASRDSLTGLPNRRAFEAHLARAVAKAERSHEHLHLFLLDLDSFKPVNDRFGHAVGDKVLAQAAERLRNAIGPADMAARLGGDEFVLVADDLDEQAAMALAARVRDAFAAPFDTDAGGVPVGVSIGVAQHRPGQSASELLRLADSRLYEMKRAGDAGDERAA